VRLQDLDYELPPELIAQTPTARREDSRLLVVERGSGALHDTRFADLGRWLRAGDALVVNETRVRPARLFLRRSTGARVEMLFVRAEPNGTWRVLARPARKAARGDVLSSEDDTLVVSVVGVGAEGERIVRVERGALASALERSGAIPLPPYIRREPTEADRERYQTVYARAEGAVAAPTAGLHFSEAMLGALEAQGVRRVALVLHVGPGTFRPITAEDPRLHRMEEEYYEVGEPAFRAMLEARAGGGRIVAVGTTSVRALESACDAGGGTLAAASGFTGKFIHPPYAFRAVDALLTNFHLPRSTLLLLVAAFGGEALVRRAYAHAVEARYRFYSYGDAMLVV
jgi:S-adenosylmethionine:tRNA ribosyltransferase-isomerase